MAEQIVPHDLIYLRGLPCPDNLPRLFGYTRSLPKVAFYWEADHLVWHDAVSRANIADWHAWRLYTEHPKILPWLWRYQWYDEEQPGPTFLLFDKKKNRVAVGPIEVVEKAVGRIPPDWDVLSAPPVNITQQDIDDVLERMRQIDPVVVEVQMKKQQKRLNELKRWLATLDEPEHGESQ